MPFHHDGVGTAGGSAEVWGRDGPLCAGTGTPPSSTDEGEPCATGRAGDEGDADAEACPMPAGRSANTRATRPNIEKGRIKRRTPRRTRARGLEWEAPEEQPLPGDAIPLMMSPHSSGPARPHWRDQILFLTRLEWIGVEIRSCAVTIQGPTLWQRTPIVAENGET
jgi:hypothetical protein